MILRDLELFFAYGGELSMLRALAANDGYILPLLPGRHERGRNPALPRKRSGIVHSALHADC